MRPNTSVQSDTYTYQALDLDPHQINSALLTPNATPSPFGNVEPQPSTVSMNMNTNKIYSTSSPFSNNSPSEKRTRDPRREEIETKAADKRKQAVKRLSSVLASRTQSLPENGLANLLSAATDQLLEDGQTVARLINEIGLLKEEIDTLKRESDMLKTKVHTLKEFKSNEQESFEERLGSTAMEDIVEEVNITLLLT
jgi:hypothetical protein